MDYVQKLQVLSNNARSEFWGKPTLLEWRSAEDEVDFTVPTDYRELVSFFGIGSFGWTIRLRNPLHPHPMFKLALSTMDAWNDVVANFPRQRRRQFYPQEGGLFCMGTVGDGAELYYVKGGCKSLLSDPHIYDCSLDQLVEISSIAEFIYKLYVGECEIELLQDLRRPAWAEGDPLFRPSTKLSIDSIGCSI